jgi:hypothetical protein
MQGGRKLSSWNLFVKKVYSEGKSKDKNYSFKQALTDASKRKGEMGRSSSSESTSMSKKQSRKQKSKKCKCPPKGGTRKRRH